MKEQYSKLTMAIPTAQATATAIVAKYADN